MKRLATASVTILLLLGLIAGPVLSDPPDASAKSPVYGGVLTMQGRPLPRNVGYQPTMREPDRVGVVQAMAETLMNIDAKGDLVPELATSVDFDPAAKTITWQLRRGVKFHDGMPFNAKAAAWNFQQLKDAGTLQFGDQIEKIETPDDSTLVFNLKNFSYLFVQAFSFNVYMYSPTPIQKNGKQWAITHVYGTGPFKLKSFDPTSHIEVEKNPNYWKPGKPYLDGLIHHPIMDPAVNYAAMKSEEIQVGMFGNLTLQGRLAGEGYKKIQFTGNPTVEFLVPSTADANSPLSNPLVREAIEYAIDRKAITRAIWKDAADPMDHMAFPGAAGYDPSIGRPYDPEKAKQLLKKAGYPGGKGINISIYVPIPRDLVRLCQAAAAYLQQVGIKAQVIPEAFPKHNTAQAQGWKNGYFYLRDPGRSPWSSTFITWFGPLPTYNAVGSLKRPEAYNQLAKKVLTVPDKESLNGIVKQLVKMAQDNSLIYGIDYQASTWVIQPYLHYDADMTKRSTFDWASLWMEKR